MLKERDKYIFSWHTPFTSFVIDPQRFPETVYADRFYQHYTTNGK